ncbi:uncharacterized protein LOC114749154 [Neltuma alba]|uniref:uncharacterized protein LOC114749154 n=1 Tax=Neltuma alba TaxID=207710 RepID=UPI0010A5824E|nr:uncharacterized protein LOC114749154 [Prosopis alba]
MSGCKPLDIPMPQNLKLLPHDERKGKEDELLGNPKRYRKLISKLLYVTITHPHISFCVQTLNQLMHNPTKAHMVAAKGVVRYLKGCPIMGLLISSEGEPVLECFCDSNWVSYGITKRSVTSYLLKFGGSSVMWKAKKQSTVSKSLTKAEYRALSMATFEIVSTRVLL